MSLNGLVPYLMPEGRVACWIHWKRIGLSKTGWGNIYILSSVLFMVSGAFQIALNWKRLMNYFRDKVRRGLRLRREMAVVYVISIWIVASSVWPYPPLPCLLDFNK